MFKHEIENGVYKLTSFNGFRLEFQFAKSDFSEVEPDPPNPQDDLICRRDPWRNRDSEICHNCGQLLPYSPYSFG